MRLIFKILLIQILLLIGISNLYSKQLLSVPVIKFEDLSYDFGKVSQGDLLEHTFSFTNEGDAKLMIQSVQPSCGCTGAAIGDKKEFDKGETGEIKVTFNTQGRSGIITKTVTITTNDEANPQVIITFTCEIVESK